MYVEVVITWIPGMKIQSGYSSSWTVSQNDICFSHAFLKLSSNFFYAYIFAGGKGAAEALVAVAALGGDGGASLSRRFGPSSPTIGYLTKSLLEATSIQRRQFLSFVTSVPIVTPGKIEVVPLVSPSGEFLPMRDPGCMPRANTCARRLYLPKFESYSIFKQVFYSVIKEESRFKGFYEWRG
jgi:hypothetical protein